MTEYSYTYRRGSELSEAEIYQAGAEREEKLAELKKAVVNSFRDETSGEIYTFCRKCFDGFENNHQGNLTYIDRASETSPDIMSGASDGRYDFVIQP